MVKLEQTENKSFALRPKTRRDRRGGLHKLKDMVYFLRDNGYTEKQLIPYDDVEYAIVTVSQGLDQRTIKKYLNQLLRFDYLREHGHPVSKSTSVLIKIRDKWIQKTYNSRKGCSNYVFGFSAPKRYVETALSAPPVTSPLSVRERVEVQGIMEKMCVRDKGSDMEAEESG